MKTYRVHDEVRERAALELFERMKAEVPEIKSATIRAGELISIDAERELTTEEITRIRELTRRRLEPIE